MKASTGFQVMRERKTMGKGKPLFSEGWRNVSASPCCVTNPSKLSKLNNTNYLFLASPWVGWGHLIQVGLSEVALLLVSGEGRNSKEQVLEV